MKPKTCLHCRKIFRGRSDKKFCSSLCRSAFNNVHRTQQSDSIVRINGILRKNRNLLQSLYLKGPKLITRKLLEEKGFQMNYHTHQNVDKHKLIQIFCYDYGVEKKGHLFKIIEDNASCTSVLGKGQNSVLV